MALKHVILTVLHQGPATGYTIAKDFDDVLGYFWSASHQQVYRDLGRLADAGLVRFTIEPQNEKPDRKVYELTEAGREELRSWAEAPIKPKKTHDELLVKLLAGELVGSTAMMALVDEQRSAHLEKLSACLAIEMEHFNSVPIDSLPPLHRLVYMTLRRRILEEESWLTWVDELEEVVGVPEFGRE